jgi:hypothetical protein
MAAFNYQGIYTRPDEPYASYRLGKFITREKTVYDENGESKI